ncbi:MAG: ABC transporter permease subunit [Treponemataceae bacterium]|nr:MAG: ABC transporter permease subunit [Treponemataceae bacterium]
MSDSGVTVLHRKPLWKQIVDNRVLFLFCIPGIIITIIFHYVPLYGVQIAFRDYSVRRGIWGSAWVGWEHFIRFFNSPNAAQIIWNTFVLSMYSLVVGFPIPIILALLLNSFRHKTYGKVIQTITYAPNFISVVVMCGMIILFLSPRVGMVNKIIEMFGSDSVNFMGERTMWRHIYVWTGVWQTMGWNSVVYFAALAGVSPDMHEAAIVDGASKMQRIFHIDLPSIMPVAVMLLILSFGSMLSIGFEKAYALQNDLNLNVSEIISTYVYKVGILQNSQAYSTAVGLFNSVVNAILLVTVNSVSRKLSDNALW